METLVVYCTRTGITEKIAKCIADQTDAELCLISDGKSYEGFFGYVRAAVVGLRKALPSLSAYSTKKPLSAYDSVVICAPIWCEDVSPVARKFLAENKNDLQGAVSLVVTHMSPLPYDEKIQALTGVLGKAPKAVLSVQTKNHDFMQDTMDFINRVKG